MSKYGNLYLIPHPISEYKDDEVNQSVKKRAMRLKFFIVERVKTARRYLKAIDKSINIDELTFFELNNHTNKVEIETYLEPLLSGSDVGLMSEAGCPGIADPGSKVVRRAHFKGINIIPLIGPSSIILALMSSGLNGQNFTFHGYLPRERFELKKKIQKLEKETLRTGYTQIFMETPYRNNKCMTTILDSCKSETLLGIASNINTENSIVETHPIKYWKVKTPDLHKKPTIFMIGK